MCTVSWLLEPDAYTLFFSRDELKIRPRAIPPRIQEINRVKVIAPQDPQGGGSWIAVNEFGTTICLLNHYGAYASIEAAKKYRTRGEIVMNLSALKDAAEIESALRHIAMNDYPPFRLLWLTANEGIRSCIWDGKNCIWVTPDKLLAPLSGSSFENDQVVFERAAAFRQIVKSEISTESLIKFHESYDTLRGPYSVNMHREDAQTMSMSVVTVTQEQVHFEYRDKPGYGFDFGATHELDIPRG